MKKILLIAALGLSATAFANDRIEQEIHNSGQFEAKRAQAVKVLEQKGYAVHDVDADDHMGKPVLDVEASKNNQEYDIKLSWPDLNIIEEKIDR